MTGYQIRNYLTILIALIVLVLFIKSPLRRGASPDDKLLFRDFKAAEVDRMTVVDKGERVELIRRAPGDWIIAREFPLPADTSSIRQAIETVAGFSSANLRGHNPAKHGTFEVDSTGAQVEVFAGGDKSAASFILGKNSGSDGTFYRLAGEDEVYQSDQPVKSYFTKPERSWQNKRIFNADKAEFSSLIIEHGDSTIVFEADADLNWHLRQPEEFPVKQQDLDMMMSRITRLYAHAMPDSAVSVETSGLATPTLSVKAARLDGSGLELLVGKQNDDGYFYCKSADSEWIYLIAKYIVDPFYRDPLEMKQQEQPPPIEPPPGAGS